MLREATGLALALPAMLQHRVVYQVSGFTHLQHPIKIAIMAVDKWLLLSYLILVRRWVSPAPMVKGLAAFPGQARW